MRNFVLTIAVIMLAACKNGNSGPDTSNTNGHSTPIDSTNVHGTAPATYGPDDPKDDTQKVNKNDTGTKANNVHRTPAN